MKIVCRMCTVCKKQKQSKKASIRRTKDGLRVKRLLRFPNPQGGHRWEEAQSGRVLWRRWASNRQNITNILGMIQMTMQIAMQLTVTGLGFLGHHAIRIAETNSCAAWCGYWILHQEQPTWSRFEMIFFASYFYGFTCWRRRIVCLSLLWNFEGVQHLTNAMNVDVSLVWKWAHERHFSVPIHVTRKVGASWDHQ